MKLGRRMMAVVSIVVIAASAMVIALRQFNRNDTVNLDPFAVAGEVMADETRALLGGRGQVVVVTCDTAKAAMPIATAQQKAFQEQLKRQGGITVAAVEALQVNPSPGMAVWSGTQYRQLLERHAGVDAIISFLGPPLFTEAEINHLPAKLPRGLVIGGGSPGQPLRGLFERGVIQVAVVPRLTPPVSGSAPPTGPEQFAQQFQVVRTDTAGTLRY